MKNDHTAILMFSGGRDSSISAVRMAKTYKNLKLVTVVSNHLYGLPMVKKRLKEINHLLPYNSEWLCISQADFPYDESLTWQTCLPCQRFYIAIGVCVAKSVGVNNLALGYTNYQQSFPEQSPYAIERLKDTLHNMDINLILPVLNIDTKNEAIEELSKYGLSTKSLEQKCLKQIINIEITGDALIKEIDKWTKAICSAEKFLNFDKLDVLSRETLK